MDDVSGFDVVSRLEQLVVDDFLHRHRSVIGQSLDFPGFRYGLLFIWSLGRLTADIIELRYWRRIQAKVAVVRREQHILQPGFGCVGLVPGDVDEYLRAFCPGQLCRLVRSILAMVLTEIIQPTLLDLILLCHLLRAKGSQAMRKRVQTLCDFQLVFFAARGIERFVFVHQFVVHIVPFSNRLPCPPQSVTQGCRSLGREPGALQMSAPGRPRSR